MQAPVGQGRLRTIYPMTARATRKHTGKAKRGRKAQAVLAALPSQRPFRLKSEEDLRATFAQALAQADGLTGAHCIHERWMRGAFPAQVEAGLAALWNSGAGPSIPEWLPMRYISWLPDAYEVAGRFSAKGRGRTNIYLVLLDFSDPLPAGTALRPAQGRHPRRRQRAQARSGGADRAGAAPAGHPPHGGGAHRDGAGRGAGGCGHPGRGRALKSFAGAGSR
jgi:hypothetical protein